MRSNERRFERSRTNHAMHRDLTQWRERITRQVAKPQREPISGSHAQAATPQADHTPSREAAKRADLTPCRGAAKEADLTPSREAAKRSRSHATGARRIACQAAKPQRREPISRNGRGGSYAAPRSRNKRAAQASLASLRLGVGFTSLASLWHGVRYQSSLAWLRRDARYQSRLAAWRPGVSYQSSLASLRLSVRFNRLWRRCGMA